MPRVSRPAGDRASRTSTPPGRSRLPLRMLTASISHDAVEPNSVVVVPMRPYTAAVGADAISWASRRIVAASTPVAAATRSGVNGAIAAANSSSPAGAGRRARPGRRARRSTITLAIAASSRASVPGRIDTHSSASSAVFERRGSTTTTLPPRARIASMRPGKSGAVHMLPFDAYGLAPSSTR